MFLHLNCFWSFSTFMSTCISSYLSLSLSDHILWFLSLLFAQGTYIHTNYNISCSGKTKQNKKALKNWFIQQREKLGTKMGNVTRSSSEVYTSDSEKGFAINHSTPAELDAGAKFVLVSRGEPAFLCSCYKTKKKKNRFWFWLFDEDEKRVFVDELSTLLWCKQDHGCTVGIIWLHLLWLRCFLLFLSPSLCWVGSEECFGWPLLPSSHSTPTTFYLLS